MSTTPEPERQRLRRAVGGPVATPKNARTARVKVDQSYIDDLLDEIQSLQKAARASEAANGALSPVSKNTGVEASIDTTGAINDDDSSVASVVNVNTGALQQPGPPAIDQARPVPETGDAVRNPLLEDRPWFFSLTPEMPILVEEAADAPFATRFRQELSGKSQRHIPRTENVKDEALTSLWSTPCAWPTPSKARFLVKAALNTICRRYYLVRRSTTLRLLEQVIHNPGICDMLSTCKLFVLFALGEVYSTRTSSAKTRLPGIEYYVYASRILRVISEQPRIDSVEVMLMLSLYSLAMNRRYGSYCMIGSAVKFSTMIGLHKNVPQSQMPDRGLQEHRKRVWWSVYTLDRFWAAQIGQAVSIRDEDIDVDLPSIEGLSPESAAEDFADPEYLTAYLRVTNLAAQIAYSVYSRKIQSTSFACRVQQALRDLSNWLHDLPDPLRAAMEELPPNASVSTTSLHLYFNHCLIRAARPIVLYVFRMRRESHKIAAEERPPIGEAAQTLSDACIQCARRCCRLLIELWINGSFPTFEIAYVHHLFSSSIVLAISSLSQTNESQSDSDDFDAAMQILRQLDENGNFAAREFSKHMQATKTILEGMVAERNQQAGVPDQNASQGGMLFSHDLRPLGVSIDTTRMTLTEPSFQELLTQSDLDLRFLESANTDHEFQAFFWPDEETPGWLNG
ncbi:hypothetical protein FDECE_669 [Fusarium decemcellulare]|nr:hypothetical protein FDECE_669 [Fusarium decemcellulare]